MFTQLKYELYTYKYHYLLVLLVTAISAYIRLLPMLQGNFPFLFDHGRDLLEVKKIVLEHDFTLIGPFAGLKGLFHGAIHYYLLAIPFILTGGHPASFTIFLIILMLISIVALYPLVARIFNRQIALIAVIIYAFAYSSINTTQHFWNPNWIPLTTVFWLAATYTSLFKKPVFSIAAFFLAGLITQFELAYGFVLLASMLCAVLIFNRSLFTSKYLHLGLLAYALTFTGHMLFDLRHNFLMSNSLLDLLSGKENSLGSPIPYPTRLYYRIDELQRATIFAVTQNTYLAYTFALTIVAALGVLIKNKNYSQLKKLLFILFTPIFYFLFFLLYKNAAWSWYWIGLQVPFYIAVAVGIYVIITQFKPLKYIYALLLLAFIIIAVKPGSTEFLKTEPGIYNNEIRALKTVFDDANGKEIGLFVYTPPIYTYNYDYLTWWYAKSHNYPQPTQSKEGDFYLIIEPDKYNPQGPKGWKETVIKDGTTVWTKELPGNITVEHRQHMPQ